MMKDAIKSILPVNLRTRLKWAGYAVKDIIDPVKDPRVPNRRDTFVGGGDFVAVGDDGQPKPIPSFKPKTDKEIAMHGYAIKLMELRKSIDKEMEPYIV